SSFPAAMRITQPSLLLSCMLPCPPSPPLFPYTTLFRSPAKDQRLVESHSHRPGRRSFNRTIYVYTESETNLGLVRGTTECHTKIDRKSTRLNSSHVKISYAVFCLKKKINTNTHHTSTRV